MYVTDIRLEGVGPLSNLTITPRFREDGAPVPIVLVGQNGAGKTLTLSVLLDAMTEAKKLAWQKIPEVVHEQFLRLMSTRYVRVGADYSVAQLKFRSGEISFTYSEVISRLDADAFRAKYPDFRLEGRDVSGQLRDGGFLKECTPTGDVKRAVGENLLLYFPYFRYERPAWLNAESATSLGLRERMIGVADDSLIQVNVVDQISRWLLDVVLDRELYERILGPLNLPGPSGQALAQIGQIFLGYSGSNTTTLNLIQEVLRAIYKARDPAITGARFGINPKANRQVSTFLSRGQTEECVSPTLAQMSSGELMLLSLFCSIIRAYDGLKGAPPQDLASITGVVIVDEIDLHLHIGLQREVLPRIIRMFPRVQFILTTHSPFFLLGMANGGDDDGVDIYGLPLGTRISPTEFSEFQVGYDIFVERNNQFRQGYENLERQLSANSRPLIVTEGKTDWQHVKAALGRLKAAGNYPSMDIELLEFGNDVDMGDTKLAQMCEHFARAPHPRRVIFMFDRDNPKIVTAMSGDEGGNFKRWSEHVFSFCIPRPAHRANYTNISIEMYYTDAALGTVDSATGKRLFFTNEVELVQRPGKRADQVRVLPVPNQGEEFEKKIFDEDCSRIRDASGSQVGHSKAVFAQNILTAQPGFDSFSVDEFRKIFDVLDAVIAIA